MMAFRNLLSSITLAMTSLTSVILIELFIRECKRGE